MWEEKEDWNKIDKEVRQEGDTNWWEEGIYREGCNTQVTRVVERVAHQIVMLRHHILMIYEHVKHNYYA